MVTNRITIDSGTAGLVQGDNYMDARASHIDRLWDASALRLTGVAGTADDPTAVVDPVLIAGLVAGMVFFFKPISNNTGAMTLKIGSEAAVAIQQSDGSALASGDVLTTGYKPGKGRLKSARLKPR